MQLNPRNVVQREIIQGVDEKQIQQVGIDLRVQDDIKLAPGQFKNVAVLEKFDMQDTFGVIIQRSSFSRRGVFTTSGVYDPGFKGFGGVSIYNMGDKIVKIKKGERIAQMIVFKADPAYMYDGHYNKSQTIMSKYEEDDDESVPLMEDKEPSR